MSFYIEIFMFCPVLGKPLFEGMRYLPLTGNISLSLIKCWEILGSLLPHMQRTSLPSPFLLFLKESQNFTGFMLNCGHYSVDGTRTFSKNLFKFKR